MRTRDNDQSAEKWLDTALKRYGDAEPRSGLENRVLANLHAEQARLAPWPQRWRLVAAAVTIIVFTGGALLLKQKPDVAGTTTSNQAAIVSHKQEPEPLGASPGKPHIAPRQPRHSRNENHIAHSSDPRLEQFPAPTPLSEQEVMLARYVRVHREEAILVARARAELLKQELERFMLQSPSERPKDLEQ
jgi:hypothetical protein